MKKCFGFRNVKMKTNVILLIVVATSAVSLRAKEPTELELLLEAQAKQVAVIEKAKPAFVFLKGIQGGRRINGIASGSGFCISPDGLVLTNNHVVEGASDVEAFISGGRFFKADIVGRDPMGDIALLKLRNAKNLPYLKLGDSSKLRPGQRVFALGDPFLIGSDIIFASGAPPNFEPSVSAGIVSAVHRYSDMYNDAIQVDLAVNRGNSGGPLLTFDGKVVGVNGKIEVRFYVGINTGVGYAVPSNQIARFLDPLKSASGGVVLHGTIRGLRVGERVDGQPGLLVTGVKDSTPASEAGFHAGDYLVRLGGLIVPTRSRYFGILGTYPAGEKVVIEVKRGEGQKTLTAILVAPGKPYLGLVPKSTDEDDDLKGVRVKSVTKAGPASQGGLKADDVIVIFGGEKIASTTDLKALLGKRLPGDEVTVKVVRDGKPVELKVTLGGNVD
jgi:serine protease Do